MPSGWTPPSDAITSPDIRGPTRCAPAQWDRDDNEYRETRPDGRDMVARVRLGGLEVRRGIRLYSSTRMLTRLQPLTLYF